MFIGSGDYVGRLSEASRSQKCTFEGDMLWDNLGRWQNERGGAQEVIVFVLRAT